MCWIGKNNKQIAKEDIKVFKIVWFIEGNHMSYFYKDCYWAINEKKTLKIKTCKKRDNVLKITKGLHSYSNNCKILVKGMLLKCVLNDVKIFACPYRGSLLHKMNCIIPKGSTYYLNSYDEYVSDALIPISFESISR